MYSIYTAINIDFHIRTVRYRQIKIFIFHEWTICIGKSVFIGIYTLYIYGKVCLLNVLFIRFVRIKLFFIFSFFVLIISIFEQVFFFWFFFNTILWACSPFRHRTLRSRSHQDRHEGAPRSRGRTHRSSVCSPCP